MRAIDSGVPLVGLGVEDCLVGVFGWGEWCTPILLGWNCMIVLIWAAGLMLLLGLVCSC